MKETSAQQKETLDYFKKNAGEWQQKAAGTAGARVNIIKERNDFVVHVAKTVSHIKRTLDVGCGSGELVVELAEAGRSALGVDFSEEMIELAKQSAVAAGQPGAQFEACSIFDYQPATPFDLISANGFIEYISLEQLGQFLDWAHANLAENGRIVLGSRNRIFNLLSLNSFTRDELKVGAAPLLLEEALVLTEMKSLDELLQVKTVDYQEPTHTHPKTGVTVATRFQYTPAQLAQIVAKHGFETVELSAVHYHGVPTAVKDASPGIHVGISELVHNAAADQHSVIPYSSSFMLHARKRD